MSEGAQKCRDGAMANPPCSATEPGLSPLSLNTNYHTGKISFNPSVFLFLFEKLAIHLE